MITVTVRPKLKVLMTSSLTGDPATLPHICWQFVVIQNPSSSKVVDPVLTFARDTTINFYQVKSHGVSKPVCHLSGRQVIILLSSLYLRHSRISPTLSQSISISTIIVISLFQVTVSLSDKIVFIPVQCVSVPYKILSLVWLNTRLLGLLSASEQFHLMDVRTGDQLESLDITCSRQGYFKRIS